jgi:hypothetical protein
MKYLLSIILNVAVGQNVQSGKNAVGQNGRWSKLLSVKIAVGQNCRRSKWPSVKAASVKRPGTLFFSKPTPRKTNKPFSGHENLSLGL